MPSHRLLAAALLIPLVLIPSTANAQAPQGNRLTYLDGSDPYYVGRTFPRLTTPQWVGEEGIEAVVILAIDDMRDPQRYESFLRPILRRLQQIDGRAPVSIMTNQVKADDPQLQKWLKEGLSLEVHTIDHPCPFFRESSFARAKSTYDRCVDLMCSIPGNHAVAFRMPCCDSLNTPTPRFWAEIFNKHTEKGNFLSIDSSVLHLFTANDPTLPRDLVLDKEGSERFRKYLPKDCSFVNTIEDYPYPYVVAGLCWEFPCVTPSDWSAQHLQLPFNPQTVRDWKAALDCTVLKQGTFSMIFHPHGWIRNDQIVELIDYAVAKHGKKVKFLTFREAQERLNKNLLNSQSLRHPKHGGDNGVRLIDVNNDGYLDVIIANEQQPPQTRIWSPQSRSWKIGTFPRRLASGRDANPVPSSAFRFGIGPADQLCFLYSTPGAGTGAWQFDGKHWAENKSLLNGLEIEGKPVFTALPGRADNGVRLRDLDGDGCCELIASNPDQQAIFQWSAQEKRWRPLPFTLPPGAVPVDRQGRDNGVRFVDLNDDGRDDVIFSNEKDYGIFLFTSMKEGWSRRVRAGKQSDQSDLPMIAHQGTNFGLWAHSRHLWWSNETTPLLKDHVARRSFNELLQDIDPPAKSPQASLQSIQVRPGFKAELMVAEPLVQSPIAFAWGPDGKLWVVEMGDYPLGVDGKGKPGGKVKFLESTKGDGKYDKMTVFMDNLGFPTGVLPWGKGVLVTCAPDIFYAEDTDGDGKADKKVVLYTGFREGNQQHRVNSLVPGLDNWIYVANGDSGGVVKSIKTGKTVSMSGRDLRIRPDTGDLEAQSGQTQYGRGKDDWGNWFGNNNSNPMYHFVLDDHYLRRNPHFAPPNPRVQVSVQPGAARVYPVSRAMPRFNDPGALNHFTSANSAIVYRDDLFGLAFANNTFISEPVHNLIHREIMTAKGITFTSRRADDEQTSEFLASSDNWFRPTTLQTGPDGALWVADMYRHVIEHPEWIPKDWQKKLDLRAGHDKGRIYRIYPVDKQPRAIPRLDKLETAELVAALDSPSGWQRDMAQMLLVRKKDRAAVPLLEKLVKESQRPQCRLHALCTLEGMNALNPEVVGHALSDKHPGVRRHAVRLCERWFPPSFNLGASLTKAEVGMKLAKLVDDPDPHVRMQLAYTLGEWDKDEYAKWSGGVEGTKGALLGELALHNSGDPYLRAACLSSVNQQNLEPMLLTVLAASKENPAAGSLVEELMRIAQRQGNTQVVGTLLGAIVTPEKGKYASWQYRALAGLLDTLDQRNESLANLRDKGDAKLKPALQKLARLFTAARKVAADSEAKPAARALALRLLGRGPSKHAEDQKLLAALMSPSLPGEVQQAAALTLGQLRDKATPALLLKQWKSFPPGLRSQVLDVLLARPDGASAVLDAVQHKQIAPREIDVARQQRLLQDKSAAIRERAARLLATAVNTDRNKVVDRYRPALRLAGDAGRGKEVFVKNCAACHQLGGVGQQVGPDLASLSGKTREYLLIAILDPNRAVEARYVNYTAVTKNGLIYTGLLASETGSSITLVGIDGKKHDLLRTDLDELASSGKSVMPEGLENTIPIPNMADLLAFIGSSLPAQKRKEFPGNAPALVRPNTDGALVLKSTNCAIYGPSLVLEKQYGNLGWWSSADDRAVWSVDVPKAGKYAVWLDWACAPEAAGNTFVLEVGLEPLTAKVQSTESWDVYRQTRVGSIRLEAGQQQITVRSAGPIRGALIDLKAIKLVPPK
jgi:putative membrane-bound dehydrogenase-like protein